MNACPTWTEGIAPGQSSEFLTAVRQVLRLIESTAAGAILDLPDALLWHRVLFANFVPLSYYAGNIRQDDPRKVCLGIDVMVGGVVGCPFAQTPAALGRLFEDLAATLRETELQWASMTAQQRAVRLANMLAAFAGEFIRIHPFVNGNGRLSRLLSAWGLQRFRVPVQFRIDPRPEQPYTTLMNSSMRGSDGPLALSILQHLSAHRPTIVL